MKPDYLVIGAQKSATSSVCDLLGQHPAVFMCDPKEPYFFSHDDIFARGMEWYESLFAGANESDVVGEGSTTYSQQHLYPNAAARIAEALPDAKLIYVVRDPLERIKSHWMHLRSKGGRETQPLHEAVRAKPEYIDHSLYSAQLEQYREHFTDDRFCVVFFEDFKSNPHSEMRRCFGFLGVDPAAWRPEHADKVRHGSAEGRTDTPMLRPLRRVPGFERLRDLMPTGARSALRSVLKKPVGERPEWTPESRAWVVSQLRDDSLRFLDRYGKPSNYWSL